MKTISRILSWAVCGIILSNGALFAGQPPAPKRLLVKLKAPAAAEIEEALPLDTLMLEAPELASTSLAQLFATHEVRRVRPVYGALVRHKRLSGLSERQLALHVRQQFAARSARFSGSFDPPELGRTYVFEVPDASPGDLERRARALRRESAVEYAEPDYIASINLVPNDPYFGSTGSWGQAYDDLYGIKKVQAPAAWDTTTGAGVVVAVVDTGFDFTHPDRGAVWTNPGEIPGNGIDDDGNGYVDDVHGWDFTGTAQAGSDNDPTDEHGHGTHVAGTIAGAGNNGLGVIGVAWQAQIMPVRGLDADGSGESGGLALALMYAAANGADVISNSWGCQCYSQAIADAVSYAQNLGAVVVAAAGNSSADVSFSTPASLPGVIAVASLGPTDVPSYFSNYGSRIDVAAPGEDILSLRAAGTTMGTAVGTLYTRASGTSMATPHVSGVAALVLSQHPEYSNDQVRQVLRMSATDVDAPGFDIYTGYGLVNAQAALAVTNPLAVRITAPLTQARLNAGTPITIRGRANGSGFVSYTLEYGQGDAPTSWTTIITSSTPVSAGTLGVLDTTALVPGSYTIRLTAQNGSAQTFVDRVGIVLAILPTVTITAPTSGAQLSGIATVTAQATGSQITQVDLFVDDSYLGASASTSLSIAWDTSMMEDGPHTLRAGVWDNADDHALSAVVTVTTTNPPPISITAPAAGAQVTGPVTITAAPTGGVIVYAMQFLVDGAVFATLYGPPYTISWDSALVGDGSHNLAARVWFSGSLSRTSALLPITTTNPHAPYDAGLKVPLCTTNTGVCDSGPLVVGRASLGPETHAPNTLQGTCADGVAGGFHYDESNDRVKVSTLDGGPFSAGKTVKIDATVWAWSTYGADQLDLFYTANANNPVWTRIATLTPDQLGLDTLSTTYVLPVGDLQAVRAQFRYNGTAVECDTGAFTDHDDLAFSVNSGVDRSQLRFGAVISGGALGAVTPAQTVGVRTAAAWTAVVDQPFLSVTPSGSGPGLLVVQLANPSGLPPVGEAQATITVTSAALSVPATIVVHVKTYAPGTTVGPVGLMETPATYGAAQSGAIAVTGWAVDDIGVSRVQIYRDAVATDGPTPDGMVYVGDATFVSGVRTDIEQVYGDRPMAYRGAWGYMMLTNMLPNIGAGAPTGGQGLFTFHAYATDVEGYTTLLGSPVVIIDNATATRPFGTIDTPASGQVLQGVFDSFGWVLTPMPAQMPIDGSTITLFIDGTPRGTAQYNLPRSDISTLFPGYANSSGPIGHFVVDTTQLANGLHTMAWGVTDNLGHGEGIGSRYFYVAN
jgi:subtilisin family serine protease